MSDAQQTSRQISPLPWMATAAAAGLLAAATPPLRLPAVLVALLGRFVLGRLSLGPVWLQRALPLLFGLSLLQGLVLLLPAEWQADQLDGATLRLQGIVCETAELSYGGRAVIRQDNGVRIMLYSDRMLVSGSRIDVQVAVEKAQGQRNPGGFDEAAWLYRQAILLKATPLPGESVAIVRDPRWSLSLVGDQVRQAVCDLAGRMLSQRQHALLSGILFGDTRAMTWAEKEQMRRAGLAHLTAVSGLHVSFILLLMTSLLRQGPLRRRGRLWLLLALLGVFGLITGWQPSVSRAIAMAATVLFGRLISRRTRPVDCLALAALVLLMLKPLHATSTGFWLSLAATAALTVLAGPMADRWSGRLPAWLPPGLVRALATTASAQIAVWPLLAGSASVIPLISFLANLPAAPLVGMITVLAAIILPLGGLLGLFSASVGLLEWVGQPLGFGLDLLTGLADRAAGLTWGRLYTAWLNPLFWLALGLGLMTVLLRGKKLKLVRRCIAPVLGAALLWNGLVWLIQAPVQVWFFDVGQGDAILIRARSGETILIDGGAGGCGERILIPALDALAIRRIDLAIATHGHDDHSGGLIELVAAGRVRQVALPAGLADQADAALSTGTDPAPTGEPFGERDRAAELLAACRVAGIPVQRLSAHDTMTAGRWLRLSVLYPPDSSAIRSAGERDGNAWSLLVLAELAGYRVLLTGDCTEAVETDLTRAGLWPEAELLKVAHHGSRLTTSASFVAQVAPQAAVISVGSNRYGHPADSVMANLAATGCTIWRTDWHGAVNVRIRQASITFRPMIPGSARIN
jgi:competence protein ComEC